MSKTKLEWLYTSEQCILKEPVNDPVHQHADGSWWFCDETWSQELGPFDSEIHCQVECTNYCNQL